MKKNNNLLFFLMVICFTIYNLHAKPLNSADVVFAIDIGADTPHTGSDGITYSAVNNIIFT